jgi:hypothetical protein
MPVLPWLDECPSHDHRKLGPTGAVLASRSIQTAKGSLSMPQLGEALPNKGIELANRDDRTANRHTALLF